LQPKICLCEGYQNMRPRCSEAFAFAHMGDSSEVFFALPPRLVHWFIRSFEDGINDVDHTRVCRLLALSGIWLGLSFGDGGKPAGLQDCGVELLDDV